MVVGGVLADPYVHPFSHALLSLLLSVAQIVTDVHASQSSSAHEYCFVVTLMRLSAFDSQGLEPCHVRSFPGDLDRSQIPWLPIRAPSKRPQIGGSILSKRAALVYRTNAY